MRKNLMDTVIAEGYLRRANVIGSTFDRFFLQQKPSKDADSSRKLGKIQFGNVSTSTKRKSQKYEISVSSTSSKPAPVR